MDELSIFLDKISSDDIDPYSGKLFAYVYETGDESIRKVCMDALKKFYDKNALDFTVFKIVSTKLAL